MKFKHIYLVFLVFLSGCQPIYFKNNTVLTRDDAKKVESIFAIFDKQMKGSDEYLKYLEEDVILMAHNVPEIKGKEDYIKHIHDNRSYGHTEIEHKLIEVHSYDDIVIARGKAVGTFQGKTSQEKITFETKNIFVLRRLKDGELRVWQTIFNMNP